MLLIPILILALSTGLLVFLLLNKPERVHLNEPVDEAAVALEEKRGVYEALEQKLFGVIERNFDRKYIQEIQNGEISTGMPAELLLMSWGRPTDVKNVLRVSGNDELWIYRQANLKTKTTLTEVRVVDKKVQGWKDI